MMYIHIFLLYIAVAIFCPTIQTAGTVWESTAAGDVLAKTCTSVDSSLRGGSIIRKCSADGVWEEPQFTRCTLDSGSPPFVLLWVVAEASTADILESDLVLSRLSSRVGVIIKF